MINMINIGKKALLTTEQHLDTIAQNITNINTPGYSRQRLLQAASSTINTANGMFGTGAEFESLTRMRNIHLDSQFRDENMQKGYWDKLAGSLSEMETELLEPGDKGLVATLNRFWDSWNDLANNPAGSTGMIYRESLVENSISLTDEFHRLDAMFDRKKNQANTELKSYVDHINSSLAQLHTLNKNIMEAKALGQNPNTLEDQFDLIMDDLSLYTNVKVANSDNGKRKLYLGTDEVLNMDTFRQLKIAPKDGKNELVWADTDELINNLGKGKLAALQDFSNEYIDSYKEQLDRLAVSIADTVNGIHTKGFSIENKATTGNLFFNPTTSARDFSVDYEILNDAEKISASGDGAVGNNRIALQIAALREIEVIDGKYSINNFYGTLLGRIGNQSNNASNKSEVYSSIASQVDGFRESIKGVSLDEETAELIKYQKAYQAAAKVVTMADQLLQTLLSIVK